MTHFMPENMFLHVRPQGHYIKFRLKLLFNTLIFQVEYLTTFAHTEPRDREGMLIALLERMESEIVQAVADTLANDEPETGL